MATCPPADVDGFFRAAFGEQATGIGDGGNGGGCPFCVDVVVLVPRKEVLGRGKLCCGSVLLYCELFHQVEFSFSGLWLCVGEY